MSYVINAVLRNAKHPEFGEVTIPFPIPDAEYDNCLELLKRLGIGDAVNRDCELMEIQSDYPALKRLEKTVVNLDELDYLAKRLGSFDRQEKAKFQGAAAMLNISDMTSLINLTFCCQEVTVITDFSDLEQVGQRHYLTMEGGGAPQDQLDQVNGRDIALALISYEEGVVYDNGMKLEQVYDGRHLPEYFYDNNIATVTLSLKEQPNQCETLYFPCADSKIGRALRRLEVQKSSQCLAELDTDICDAVRGMFEEEFELNEHLETLNALARCYQGFDDKTLDKFHTVFDSAWPQTPEEVLYLAKHVHDFTMVEGISTAEEYGRYMIKEAGHFELDPNLEDYVDFESYGKQRIQEEQGILGDRGYVAFLGMEPEITEIMARHIQRPEQGPQLGGLT